MLTGAARERLGEVMAQALLRRQPDAAPEIVAAERAKLLRAPALIAVGVDKPSGPKVVEIENICAAAAATQNILLAAQWRTGAAASEPAALIFRTHDLDGPIGKMKQRATELPATSFCRGVKNEWR